MNNKFKSIVSKIDRLDYKTYDKLIATNIIYKESHLKLVEAMWAIENWEVFRTYLLRRNKWPKFVGKYDYSLPYSSQKNWAKLK